uniref:Uncharacterized protein n=1 Tax=Vespula pensylvanica TaxID=30213 RepID=A0A834UDG2_VESPE|nr:hypothetical protein H0235_002075 [Vespula pensylvanica]
MSSAIVHACIKSSSRGVESGTSKPADKNRRKEQRRSSSEAARGLRPASGIRSRRSRPARYARTLERIGSENEEETSPIRTLGNKAILGELTSLTRRQSSYTGLRARSKNASEGEGEGEAGRWWHERKRKTRVLAREKQTRRSNGI